MADKKKEQAMVVSQEQIADGIFSMWIHTAPDLDSLLLCIHRMRQSYCLVRSVSVRLTKKTVAFVLYTE